MIKLSFSIDKIINDIKGVAVIEFSLVLPVMLILALPLYNYIHFIMVHQKVNKAAATLADMIVMSTPMDATTTAAMADSDKLILSNQSLQMIVDSTKALMQPLGFVNASGNTCSSGALTIDSIHKPVAVAAGTVWNATYAGEGTAVNVTNYATPQPLPATVTPAFAVSMADDENAIAVNLSCRFEPPIVLPINMGMPVLNATTINATYIFPARNGPLTQVFAN